MWWGSAKVAKICKKDQFYYITPEHTEKGWFEIYSCSQIRITDKTVYNCPDSGTFVAVPREVIDNINPSIDFVCKIRISCSGKCWNIGECMLKECLDETTCGRSDYLTWAFSTGSDPCIDMGDHFWILSGGVKMPKFECKNIMEKLCRCLHECIVKSNKYQWPDFMVENESKTVSVKTSMSLSEELNEILSSKNVGTIELPKKDNELE